MPNLTGRGFYQKSHPVKDDKARKAWAAEHAYCFACGVGYEQSRYQTHCGGVPITIHHIVKPGRSDEPCNWCPLCYRDHSLAENRLLRDEQSGELLPFLKLGIVLTIKKLRDPLNFDPDRLQVLLGERLPDLEPLPAFLAADWNSWRGGSGSASGASVSFGTMTEDGGIAI